MQGVSEGGGATLPFSSVPSSRTVCQELREQFLMGQEEGSSLPSSSVPSSQNEFVALRESLQRRIILPSERGIVLDMVNELERWLPVALDWQSMSPKEVRDWVKVAFPTWNDHHIAALMGTVRANNAASTSSINLGFGLSSSTSSSASFRFHEIGVRALESEIDITLVDPLDDSKAEILWPIEDWEIDSTPGKSMVQMLEGMEFKDCTFELVVDKGSVDSVCGKGSRPDLILKLKGHSLATYCTGALICLHSRGQVSRVDNTASVGEAVVYGRRFLKEAGPSRQFIYVGVTDLKEIMWLKVFGGGNTTRSPWTTKVRQSLCAFLCAAPPILGLQVGSHELKLPANWQWKRTLGFGRTSIVYEMEKDNVRYAVKIPQNGAMLTEDFVCLSRLKDVAGVPTLCLKLGGMLALQPVGEPFDRKRIKMYGLAHSLGQLVDILKEAHSREIVNRDIRIENIMIAQCMQQTKGEERLYILDWGFGTLIDVPASFSGCFYTASNEVIKQFVDKEREKVEVVYKAADDLVALVRCLFMLFQEDASNDLKNSYRSLTGSVLPTYLLEFWNHHMQVNPSWKRLECYAMDVNYDTLREELGKLGDFL